MTRRRRGPYTYRVKCAHEGCLECAFYEYQTRADYVSTAKSAQGWRCTRHSSEDELLGSANLRREMVLTVGLFDGLDKHYFLEKHSGFVSGPGFKALAEDFPLGTRIRVTARVEMAGSGAKASPEHAATTRRSEAPKTS